MSAIRPWHAEVWRRFAGALARGQLAHGLLLHGEGGLHKHMLARTMAAALLCGARGDDGQACGRCRGCVLLAAGNHPDLVEVMPVDSAQIKVDQIRELSERLSKRPQIAQVQVAVIEPAERMNVAAANALLKTLEEPAGDTFLILVSDRLGRLPATIRSRCQRLGLAGTTAANGAEALARACGGDPDQAALALAVAGGDPELAESLLAPGAWAEWTGLREQLSDLARGHLPAVVFAQSAAKVAGPLLARWSRLIALAVRGLRTGDPAWDAFVGLTSAREMSSLLPFVTQLESSRAMLGSGVREDLMLVDLARAWQALFAR
jgi:DNA polymerase-3 subunit delta'